MEDTEYLIRYTSEPPTLQDIALVSIAIRLWSEPGLIRNVRQYSERFGFDRTGSALKAYNEFRGRVSKKLSNLLLPNSLNVKVYNIIPPIGFQLLKGFSKRDKNDCNSRFESRLPWFIQDREYCRFYDIFKVGGSVHWTMEGIIDNVSSLKELINNENEAKDFDCLFELASKYCLEEYIPNLWRKIPKYKMNIDHIYENYDDHIVAYWIASIKNEIPYWWAKIKEKDFHNVYDNNLSIPQNMISLSVFVNNPYSLKYFWHKLKEQEKDANVRNWITQVIRKYNPNERHEYHIYKDKTTILCFLLSQMNDKKQQKEVFQIHSEIILKALFFDWPWQRFFLPTITKMLGYVPERSFSNIMSIIAEGIKQGRTTVDLFREIWIKSSLKLKKSFFNFLIHTKRSCTDHRENTSALYRFIDIGNIETILMILKFASEKEKKRILFQLITNYELRRIIDSNKLSLIETLLTECLSSAHFISKLKNFIMIQFTTDLSEDWILKNNFQALETFLKWGFQSTKKHKNFKNKFIHKNDIYKSLVCRGDYELLDRFMNWYFESEDEIYKFKKAYIFEVDKDESFNCLDLLRHLSYDEQGWDLFEKFINYSCDSLEEVSQFKSMILGSVTHFLSIYKFQFASKFVNWCIGSADEVNRFKNMLVLSDKVIDIILFSVNMYYPKWTRASELVKWFSISKITAADLKYRLDKNDLFLRCGKDNDCKRRGLIYLLDKHVVGSNIESKDYSENSNTNSDVETEMMEMLANKL